MKFLFLFIPFLILAQRKSIPLNSNFPKKTNYTVYAPKSKIISYLLYFGYGNRYEFYEKCNKNGILVITITKLPTVLFFQKDYVKDVNFVLDKVFEKYELKGKPFIVGGMSRFGNGAIYFAEHSNKFKTKYIPDGIFAVDPPVDIREIWNWTKHRKLRRLAESTIREHNTIKRLAISAFGGSPEEYPEKYKKMSPYYRADEDGGNIVYIKNTPLLIFAEPGINWWLKNKYSDLYTSNILPISSMINDLQSLGNNKAELYITHDKRYNNGKRHPHSWSIVNQEYLIKWIKEIK